MRSIEQYWEWLCSIPGIYYEKKEILLQCFHDPEAIYNMTEKEVSLMETRGFQWIRQIAGFRCENTVDAVCEQHWRDGIHFVSCENDHYPSRLKGIAMQPYGIFYKGKLPSEKRNSIAIVGARMCSRQGKEIAETLARAIVLAGGQVISGAAFGIDGAAQRASLIKENSSFGVLGCGVDICYPPSHEILLQQLSKEGGVLSEYAPGTPAMKFLFPLRNRIISGLSDAVIVVEAKIKSGSLITAQYAMNQGRRIFAVPGRPGDVLSEGCNELINQGSELILSVESFIRSVFPDNNRKNLQLSEDITLAPREKLVYSSFGLHAKNLWDLQEATELTFAELSEALLSLECKGLICESEQNWYRKMN